MRTTFTLGKLLPFLLISAALSTGCKNSSTSEEVRENPYNEIIERAKYEFERTKDPRTGRIPEGIHEAELLQAMSLPTREEFIASHTNSTLANNAYTPVGPDNLGGRTRALAFDSRYNGTTNRVMLAGSVSSGVFRTDDGGATWTRVNGTNTIHNITSIAQDNSATGNKDTWYLTTGEALGNSTGANGAFYLGHGVYKSTDNGLTWAKLAASNTGALETFDRLEDLVSKVVVNPVNGDVYIAAVGEILRSTDGGTSWNVVLVKGNNSGAVSDVVINSAGVVFAAMHGGAGVSAGGAGIWRSATGASGSYTRITSGGSPFGWPADQTYGRIVLALAPSNNSLYALLENPAAAPAGHSLFNYDIATSTWGADKSGFLPDEPGGNLSGNDPFDSQGGYDLCIAVKPDNANFVIIGGTNVYRSTDGWSSTTNYKRIGGYGNNLSYALYTNHHPDIHAFAFQPDNASMMACGDDGGIQIADVTQTTVAWTPLNNQYRTFQYYYVAIDPTPGSTKYLGGAQDNGTTYRGSGTNNFNLVFGGDGVSVGISAGNAFHYCGSQQGNIVRRTPASVANSGTNIKPSGSGLGTFVTLFHLFEENTEDLVYASTNRLYRTASASTVTTAGWTELTGVGTTVGAANEITALATTRYAYTPSHNLYIGTSNARIYRLTDPRNVAAATAPLDITPGTMSAGSTVSGIAVAPGNPDIVMAVVSNYGVPSVFLTTNATTAAPFWRTVEGNLTLPSFRSCEIITRQIGAVLSHEYYVGTSAGLFSTTLIDVTTQATANLTQWTREGAGVIDQAVVQSLVVRPGDNTLLVGTHGNGMFTAQVANPVPVTLSDFNATRYSNYVGLNWTVSSEFGVKEYQLQRKYRQDVDFTDIGKVASLGNTSASRAYSFKDLGVSFSSGTIQYRLKTVDFDGKISYSKIVSVNVPAKDFIVNIYPTVVNDVINIETGTMTGLRSMKVSIVNNEGKYLSTTEYPYQQTKISVQHLPAGMYNIVVSNGTEERFTRRFIKH